MSDTKAKGVNPGMEEIKEEELSQVSGGAHIDAPDASVGLAGDADMELMRGKRASATII